jgi:transcription initiation factor TFIIB
MIHDHGVSTSIPRSRDPRLRKLAALNSAARIGNKRNVVEMFILLNRYVKVLNAPQNVAYTAAVILRKLLDVLEKKRKKIAKTEPTILAIIYAAAKLERHLLTIDDIVEATKLPKQAILNAYKRVVKELSLHVISPSPQQLVPRVASKLQMSGAAELLAVRLLNELKKAGKKKPRSPATYAAAALYLASILLDERRNQVDVAKAAGVTDASLRNGYRDILDNLWIEVEL